MRKCLSLFLLALIVSSGGCAVMGQPTTRDRFDFTPSKEKRTGAEAREAFKNLLEIQKKYDAGVEKAEYWECRELEERYSLIVYNAGEDAAPLLEEAILGTNDLSKRVAIELVAREVDAADGWHKYDRLTSTNSLSCDDLFVRHISDVIDAPHIYPRVLRRFFMGSIWISSFPAAYHSEEVTNHPLRNWVYENLCKSGCEGKYEEAARKTLKEWAQENAETFEKDYHDYWDLIAAVNEEIRSKNMLKPPTTHFHQPDETISGVAEHYYGKRTEEGLQAILKANPGIDIKGTNYYGRKVTIPELE